MSAWILPLRLLMLLAVLGLLQVACSGVSRSAPRIELDLAGVTDPAVIDALRTGLNLPLLEKERGPLAASGEPSLGADVDTECPRLTSLVRAFGYLEAQVSCRMVLNPDDREAMAVVQIAPVQGPLYRIGVVEVAGVANQMGDAESEKLLGESLIRYMGQVARADRLSEIESRVLRQIRKTLHPLARASSRTVTLDAARHLALVTIGVEIGPAVSFGDVTYRGFRVADPRSIGVVAPFEPGDSYDEDKLEGFRSRLANTGLFKAVRVVAGDELDQDGRLPVFVTVSEKPPDVDDLMRSGINVSLAIGVSLVLVALRLLARFAGSPRGLQRSLDAVVVLALAASTILAVLRVMSFV